MGGLLNAVFGASVHTEDDVFQDGRMHFFDMRYKISIFWLCGVSASLYHHGISGGLHNIF